MTAAGIPILGDKHYVSYVGPIEHLGANQSTHLAEIKYPVQHMPVISVVKWMPPSGLTLCNEALAWLFLRGAGVQQTKHAGIVVLSHAKAKAALGKKTIAAELLQQGHVLAWASQKLPHPALKVLFAGTEGDRRWAKLMSSVQGSAIAAFDEAFLALDRNNGNLLYLSDDACIPVDHECIFGLHDWTKGPIPASSLKSDTLRRLEAEHKQRRLSTFEYQQACGRIVFHAQKHQFALEAARDEMQRLLTQVFPGHGDRYATHVLSFVAERTAQRWMEDRLGVM